MDDEGVHQLAYQHALRVAHLHQLLANPTKAFSAPAEPSSPLSPRRGSSASHSSHSINAANWGSALFGIGDVFGKAPKSGGEAPRFPKELLKVLDARIDSIVKGSETSSAYRDDIFRSCVGAFYGTYKDPSLQRELKDNRKIEDLILRFVTISQKVLRKRTGVSEDWWKHEFPKQSANFVRILKACLQQTRKAPPELFTLLDTYLAPLEAQDDISSTPSVPPKSSRASVLSVEPSASRTEFIKAVQELFNISDEQLAVDLKEIRKTCTLKVRSRLKLR